MSVDREDIVKVSQLAKIKLDEEQIPEITQRINSILSMVDQMQAVDTSGVEPMANPLDAVQRLRVDEVSESNQREKLLTNAPADNFNFKTVILNIHASSNYHHTIRRNSSPVFFAF